jgi:hypothetical protein
VKVVGENASGTTLYVNGDLNDAVLHHPRASRPSLTKQAKDAEEAAEQCMMSRPDGCSGWSLRSHLANDAISQLEL